MDIKPSVPCALPHLLHGFGGRALADIYHVATPMPRHASPRLALRCGTPVGAAVANGAGSAAARLRAASSLAGTSGLPVTIAFPFASDLWPVRLWQAWHHAGSDAGHALQLALPHGVLASLDDTGLATLRGLRSLGFALAANGEDGVADLRRLADLEIAALRIRAPSPGDQTRLPGLHATVSAAGALGLTVVATGIRTEAQRATMALLGCDEGEGPLFGAAGMT
jgi:hypothetical protein